MKEIMFNIEEAEVNQEKTMFKRFAARMKGQ